MSAKQIILTELRKLQALQAALDPANDPLSTSSLLTFFIAAIDIHLVDRPTPDNDDIDPEIEDANNNHGQGDTE